MASTSTPAARQAVVGSVVAGGGSAALAPCLLSFNLLARSRSRPVVQEVSICIVAAWSGVKRCCFSLLGPAF